MNQELSTLLSQEADRIFEIHTKPGHIFNCMQLIALKTTEPLMNKPFLKKYQGYLETYHNLSVSLESIDQALCSNTIIKMLEYWHLYSSQFASEFCRLIIDELAICADADEIGSPKGNKVGDRGEKIKDLTERYNFGLKTRLLAFTEKKRKYLKKKNTDQGDENIRLVSSFNMLTKVLPAYTECLSKIRSVKSGATLNPSDKYIEEAVKAGDISDKVLACQIVIDQFQEFGFEDPESLSKQLQPFFAVEQNLLKYLASQVEC